MGAPDGREGGERRARVLGSRNTWVTVPEGSPGRPTSSTRAAPPDGTGSSAKRLRYNPLTLSYEVRFGLDGSQLLELPRDIARGRDGLKAAWLDLADPRSGAMTFGLPQSHGHGEAPNWIDRARQDPAATLAALDAEIAAPVPKKGWVFKRDDPAAVQRRLWLRALAALAALAADHDNAVDRAVTVLEEPGTVAWLSLWSDWANARCHIVIGELELVVSDGVEAVILAIVAKLHRDGEYDTAFRVLHAVGRSAALTCAAAAVWFSWADAGDSSTDFFEAGDFSLADPVRGILLSYKARTMQRVGAHAAAARLFDEIVAEWSATGTKRTRYALEYLHARACIDAGRTSDARLTLERLAVEAPGYLDAAALAKEIRTTPDRQRRTISKEVVRQVFARDRGRCCECGTTSELHVDHRIPVSRGGSNHLDNLQLLCGTCNRRKATRVG